MKIANVVLCFFTLCFSFELFALDVRVLLGEYLVAESPVLELAVPGGFLVERLDGSDTHSFDQEQVHITFSKGRVLLNGRPMAVNQFLVRPKSMESGIGFLDHIYDGSFVVSFWQGKLFVVNQLDLELYLYSVLRWEGWPTWPEEANRAFAIVCQTYAAHKVFVARKRKKEAALGLLFDIKASNAHQTYQGRHGQKHWKHVVEDTAGVVLVYNGEPIAAMYDMSCGGVIPSSLTGIDFVKYPYLKRTYPCTACQAWPYYRWEKTYSLPEFEALFDIRLRSGMADSRLLSTVSDAAGVLQKLSLKTRRGVHQITGKKLYSVLKKDVKSLCCSVQKKGRSILVSGTGYGHLLGYCQWGAAYMAKEQGMKCKELLSFFYPEVQLMTLKRHEDACAGV